MHACEVICSDCHQPIRLHQCPNTDAASAQAAVGNRGAVVRVPSGELLGWLGEKITDAQKQVKTREQMARDYRSGTDAQWKAAAQMHPSTAGRWMKKGERADEAARQDRITERCRRELKMFEALAEALSHPNIAGEPRPPNTSKLSP